jgi:hypothetical protein
MLAKLSEDLLGDCSVELSTLIVWYLAVPVMGGCWDLTPREDIVTMRNVWLK